MPIRTYTVLVTIDNEAILPTNHLADAIEAALESGTSRTGSVTSAIAHAFHGDLLPTATDRPDSTDVMVRVAKTVHRDLRGG